MTELRMPEAEIDHRGEELCRESMRALMDTPETLGRENVIDVETGDYETDADGLTASLGLAGQPDLCVEFVIDILASSEN